MASASLTSAKGPSWTRNSLSVVACGATNAGYSFFFRASTSACASSCLLTAATWTKYPAVGSAAEDSLAFAVGLGVAAVVVALVGAAAVVSVFESVGVVSSALA